VSNVRITVEATFRDAIEKLPPDRQRSAISAVMKFQTEPTLPSLRFRPLQGAPGYFIISANRGDRVILRRDAENLYAAVDVGPHDNVYNRWNR
jgi:hypothetical protein